ncbi:hypothetical protein ACCO45_001334 [Purpureocillium lilacinum]|uniref:Uncharacterized protein n=1 Tax=Purpureocillium lilacinum TaxID=33203 RepID=A0ACC4E6R3_PURLI
MPRPPCRGALLFALRPSARWAPSYSIYGSASPLLVRGPAAVAAASPSSSRTLLTLAIETSCDDTAVAVLSRCRATGRAALLFNERVSSDNRAFRGVNPVVAVQGHNASLGPLVRRALAALPDAVDDGSTTTTATATVEAATKRSGRTVDVDGRKKALPDFVSVTRGPGIMANLAVGLNVAKGLAVAWGVPLLAVHHMQAHALTPRLVGALGMDMAMGGSGSGNRVSSSNFSPAPNESSKTTAIGGDSGSSGTGAAPDFPFLSLLVSGGHTQLVHSASLTDHRIVATTGDIAIGNLLDQTARVILPEDVLEASPDVMYGRLLDAFAFPLLPATATTTHEAFFRPAASRADEIADVPSGYDWTVPLPFRNSRRLAYSFSSIHTHVHRVAAQRGPHMDLAERRALARHTLRAAFQHLASRLVLALEDRPELLMGDGGSGKSNGSHNDGGTTTTLVVAGGVASNRFLAHVLRTTLAARGFPGMYEAGWRSDLSACPIGKWPMDPSVGPGILGVDGWLKDGAEA